MGLLADIEAFITSLLGGGAAAPQSQPQSQPQPAPQPQPQPAPQPQWHAPPPPPQPQPFVTRNPPHVTTTPSPTAPPAIPQDPARPWSDETLALLCPDAPPGGIHPRVVTDLPVWARLPPLPPDSFFVALAAALNGGADTGAAVITAGESSLKSGLNDTIPYLGTAFVGIAQSIAPVQGFVWTPALLKTQYQGRLDRLRITPVFSINAVGADDPGSPTANILTAQQNSAYDVNTGSKGELGSQDVLGANGIITSIRNKLAPGGGLQATGGN